MWGQVAVPLATVSWERDLLRQAAPECAHLVCAPAGSEPAPGRFLRPCGLVPWRALVRLWSWAVSVTLPSPNQSDGLVVKPAYPRDRPPRSDRSSAPLLVIRV
jgi:hypothetical protein